MRQYSTCRLASRVQDVATFCNPHFFRHSWQFLDGCGLNATLKLCLSTDEDEFGGASRSTWTTPSASVECAEGASASGSRDHAFHVRLPPQAGCVFCPSDMFVDHSGGLPWT
eukprot:1726641-Pleurochrysis_carterae.AAC.2